MEKIKKLFNELESSISSERFITIYENIRQKYPAIKSCPTAAELMRYLHDQENTNYELKDVILSNLILEYQSEKNELIGSYFLILFKPAIMKIFFRLRTVLRQYPSIATLDIGLETVGSFFDILSSFDIEKHDSRIALKIIDKLKKRTSAYIKKTLKEHTAEYGLESEAESLSFEPANTNQEEVLSLLENLTKAGIISKVDKHILLSAGIYGKSMKEISRDLEGISYTNIRQRKIRAQKAIRAYLKKKKF